LILEHEALDLVVVDSHGNDDGAESVIAGGEAAADFLGSAVEAADGEECVYTCANQEGEKPAESNQQEAADFFGVFARWQVAGAGR